MPYQLQCKVCPNSYIVVTEFTNHLKAHLDEDEKAKTTKTQDEQNVRASMLQRSIDIKLENEEIQS